jgi:hypothetical protein
VVDKIVASFDGMMPMQRYCEEQSQGDFPRLNAGVYVQDTRAMAEGLPTGSGDSVPLGYALADEDGMDIGIMETAERKP